MTPPTPLPAPGPAPLPQAPPPCRLKEPVNSPQGPQLGEGSYSLVTSTPAPLPLIPSLSGLQAPERPSPAFARTAPPHGLFSAFLPRRLCLGHPYMKAPKLGYPECGPPALTSGVSWAVTAHPSGRKALPDSDGAPHQVPPEVLVGRSGRAAAAWPPRVVLPSGSASEARACPGRATRRQPCAVSGQEPQGRCGRRQLWERGLCSL